MYLDFFELKTKPFELVPNPKFLFPSTSHRKALSYLRYGIHEQAGFILLTGEVGSGKTTLIRGIIDDLGDDTVLAMVFNTRVTVEQLLAMINEEFGLPTAGRDKVALLRELNDFLIAQVRKGVRPILIVDEAQNLTAEALEEIRLLSNLEANSFKLLQIILVGQPELRDMVAQYGLRQLRQRISIHCHIQPLSPEETQEYILHRLETAGNREALSFPAGTFDVIYQYSGGIPRLINVFCDFLLLAAFVEKTRELTLDLVQEVVGDVIGGLPLGKSSAPADEDPFAVLEREEALGAIAAAGFSKETEARILERLAVHENVLKQVVRKQQDQLKSVHDTLGEIISKLDELRAAVERDPRKGLRVIPGREG